MKTLEEILRELAGYASLCWEPKPTGIFDAEEASKAVNSALASLREVMRNEGSDLKKNQKNVERANR